jgi:hypothetical protein
VGIRWLSGGLLRSRSIYRTWASALYWVKKMMDPASALIGALLAGALSASQEVASDAVKAAYFKLKSALKERFGVNVERVEELSDVSEQEEELRKIVSQDMAIDDEVKVRLSEFKKAISNEGLPQSMAVSLKNTETGKVFIGELKVEQGLGVHVEGGKTDAIVIRKAEVGTSKKN